MNIQKSNIKMRCESFSTKNNPSRSTSINTVAFKSQPIYKLKIKKLMPDGRYNLVPALFSKLDSNSHIDIEAIKKIKAQESKNSDYFGNMAGYFLNKSTSDSFYVIELLDDGIKNLSDRITCLMQVDKISKKTKEEPLFISFIESKSNIVRAINPEVRGSGELGLYGLVKLAKKNKKKTVELFTSNESFYKKMGFKRLLGSSFTPKYELNIENYDYFINRVEEKYEIKSSSPKWKDFINFLVK